MIEKAKLMKPVNLRGLALVKESVDAMLADAEKSGMTGDLVLTIHMKSGGVVGLRQASTKTIPMTETNA